MNKQLQNTRLLFLWLIYSLNIALCVGSPSTEYEEDVLTKEILAQYPIVNLVNPLIMEQQNGLTFKEKLDSSRHARSVSSILEKYISPCKGTIERKDFNNPKTFSEAEALTFFLRSIPAPFINCSFANAFDFNEEDTNCPLNRFIKCALHNSKIVIFCAGNHNQVGSSRLNKQDQKENIVYVGALFLMDSHKQSPALYSGIAGKDGDQFIWASGRAPIDQPYSSGTSFAAPRVTGVLCRLLGAFPDLMPQEALKIVFLTATKTDFYSTGDQAVDKYLYGSYGALDPKGALDFAAQFVNAKKGKKDLTPQIFYRASQQEKPTYALPKTLREKLNLMALLEEHHADKESDPEEKRVLDILQKMAREIDIGVLCSQFSWFFIPNDLYALSTLMIQHKDTTRLEQLIKKTFNPSIRSSKGWTPLHHAVAFKNFELVKYFTESSPTLVNDMENNEGCHPLFVAVADTIPNLNIVKFLLDHNSRFDIKSTILPFNPFQYVLSRISSLKEAGMEAKTLKEVALLFRQHKDYDPQKCFLETSLEKYAQDLELNIKHPELYQALVGKQRLN